MVHAAKQIWVMAIASLFLLSSLTAFVGLATADSLEVRPEYVWLSILSPQNKTYDSIAVPLSFTVQTNSLNRTTSLYYYSLDDGAKSKINVVQVTDQREIPQNVSFAPYTEYILQGNQVLHSLQQGTHTLSVYYGVDSGFVLLGAVAFRVDLSPKLPFVGSEFANGTISDDNAWCHVWYDWVNVSGTQVINYVMYSDAFNSPLANLVGQHLRLADGSEVFVAGALGKMEIYHDSNGDGIPQANFTSGQREILYYMFMNMSEGYSIIPIEKVLDGSVPHYQWGFSYERVYAYIINSSSQFNLMARVIFDHITISYDFSVDGNVSNLKTNFDIGKIATMDMLASPDFSLDGLSLALLYTTATYASKPYATSVDGQPYNSANAANSATSLASAAIDVGDSKAYEFVFGGNYTLYRASNSSETYAAKAEAAALTSLPFKVYGPAVPQVSFFRDELNLTMLFGGSWPEFKMGYETSAFIYRICFQVWDGEHIMHDPVYVGYVSSATVPEYPVVMIPVILVAAALIVIVLRSKDKKQCR